MKKELHKRIALALEEEESNETDMELLDLLRLKASEETFYFDLTPARRNGLNIWFSEVKDLLLQELLDGNFGAGILLDSFFIMCFEVGFRMGELEEKKKEGEI